MKSILLFCLCVAICATWAAAEEPPNLVKNGSFSEVGKDGLPLDWKMYASGQSISVDKSDPPAGADQSLRIDVKQAAEAQGSIAQTVRNVPKNAKLILKAHLKGSATRLGYIQVKLKRQGKEFRRERTDWNTTEWEERKIEFDTEDADELSIECRFSQSDKAMDQTVWFAGLALVESVR